MTDPNTESFPEDNLPVDEAPADVIVGVQNPLLSNAVYDKLKFLALVVLPAVGAAYFSFASIWGLPAAEEVVGTIVVIDTFLGVLLGASNKSYINETEGPTVGILHATRDAEGVVQASLEFPGNPMDVIHKDKVTFKVVNDAQE